jgi:hypothetical protein
VFGYASLADLDEPLLADGVEHAPLAGRLLGFRRRWGVAMNNWEGGQAVKHFVDPETGERPRIRVAYLDLREADGEETNGLALPVDADRLEMLDAREVNYSRVDVTPAFEPALPAPAGAPLKTRLGRVFTYVGTDAARERCRAGVADGDVFVGRDYVATVRGAFARLATSALEEFDRTTDPLPFPERDLDVIL